MTQRVWKFAIILILYSSSLLHFSDNVFFSSIMLFFMKEKLPHEFTYKYESWETLKGDLMIASIRYNLLLKSGQYFSVRVKDYFHSIFYCIRKKEESKYFNAGIPAIAAC